jgi:hypothetical protein
MQSTVDYSHNTTRLVETHDTQIFKPHCRLPLMTKLVIILQLPFASKNSIDILQKHDGAKQSEHGGLFGPIQHARPLTLYQSQSSTMHAREEDDYNETKSCGGSDDLGAIEEEEALEIAKSDTKALVMLKMAALVLLVCSALVVALTTYFYVSKSEQSSFENHFRDDAHKILRSIESTIDKTLGLFDGLAVTTVSHARATGMEWPFVTLPDFGVRLAKILPLSKAIAIYLIPVVTPAKRSKWEAYTLTNDDWVNETLGIQYTWKGYYGPTFDHWEPHGVIHGDFDDIPRNET